MNDDVNDAAWILVHCAHDVSGHVSLKFTVEERMKLLDAARLYCAVAKRYEVADV